jgi:hypothetical protein
MSTSNLKTKVSDFLQVVLSSQSILKTSALILTPPLKSKGIQVISVLYFERLEMQAEILHVDINVGQPNIWQSPPCTSG